MRHIVPSILATVFLIGYVPSVTAQQGQEELRERVDQLESQLKQMEAEQRELTTRVRRDAGAVVLFLFGAFCALWAQNTNRSPWLWFFLGLFFHVITVLVLLAKNSDDRRQARGEPPADGSLVLVAIISGVLLLASLGAILYWMLAA